jgi:hypothetical protein
MRVIQTSRLPSSSSGSLHERVTKTCHSLVPTPDLRQNPHGKPVAFYSDKHSIFRVSKEEASGGDGMTQFSRALAEAPASGASWDLPATRPGGSVSILKQYVCDEPAVHASFFGYQKSIRAAQLTPACPRYPSSPSTDDDGVERRSECARETSQSSCLGTYSACRDIVAEATAVRSPLALLQGW